MRGYSTAAYISDFNYDSTSDLNNLTKIKESKLPSVQEPDEAREIGQTPDFENTKDQEQMLDLSGLNILSASNSSVQLKQNGRATTPPKGYVKVERKLIKNKSQDRVSKNSGEVTSVKLKSQISSKGNNINVKSSEEL